MKTDQTRESTSIIASKVISKSSKAIISLGVENVKPILEKKSMVLKELRVFFDHAICVHSQYRAIGDPMEMNRAFY